MLQHLFTAFVQADKTLNRSRGGLGLGLALVKGLVDLHEGKVEVKSESIGKGSEFTVRIPLDDASAEEAKEDEADSSHPKRNVLIIEDNIDSAESLRVVLEMDGHAVEVARTGVTGLAKTRQCHPEIVFCDIGLPEMDGFEVARAIRKDPELQGIYLVAMTGYALPEDMERAKEAGFDRHLAKPLNFNGLRVLLGEVG